MALHGTQQGHRSAEVVFVVEQRVLHALAHLAGSCKVHHRLDGVLPEHLIHKIRVGDIPHIERGIPHRCPGAPG